MIHKEASPVHGLLSSHQVVGDGVTVTMDYSIVRLLSEQLYQSPLKAIEELVVNAYDAHAELCRVFVPSTSDSNYIAVYDNGEGMDYDGLINLWQIGHSNKRDEEIERRNQRKQIGKFGIGKLATYTIASQLTYVTKKHNSILAVTIDFCEFETPSEHPHAGKASSEPKQKTVRLTVHNIENLDQFTVLIGNVLQDIGLQPQELQHENSWTLAILEKLKDKGKSIKYGRLEWVLRTAMPRSFDFQIFLNNELLSSARKDYEVLVEFSVTELPEKRLDDLSEKVGEKWFVEGDQLKTNNLFKQGVSGIVVVTERTLTGGKSQDLGRSHGFFVRVRDRLINEDDPLFGLKAQVHDTFNRLDAQVRADDLDKVLTASRDSIEVTTITEAFQELLRQLFLEADSRYKRLRNNQESGKKEGEKEIVKPYLVEYPLADALLTQNYDKKGPEVDEGWFYIDLDDKVNLDELVYKLYTDPRSKYRYQYTSGRSTDRLVKFDPTESIFWLNESHEFVQEHMGNVYARQLLHDFVTAEMLLEIYLRDNQIPPHLIGHILEQRDELLRALARDRSYSFKTIAQNLRRSSDDEYELEINLVIAMRALGFTANHISGSGEPDGIGRHTNYPGGQKTIILEAKSSKEVPGLGAIDFAGLHSHKKEYKADGCLLVAPSYPGSSREDSEAAKRAKNLGISCWTVEQLARFVEVAEARHLNATHVIKIVENFSTPDEVSNEISRILSEPAWDNQRLYQSIISALRKLSGRLPDMPRSIELVSGRVIEEEGLSDVTGDAIDKAVRELASASQGGMSVDGQTIRIHVALEELERRVAHLTIPNATSPRRISSFRKE